MNRLAFIFCVLLLTSACSNKKSDNKMQFLFPLGLSLQDFMQDDYIVHHKSSCSFLSELAVEKELRENYECEDGFGGVHDEDNFNTVDDLKGVKAVIIRNYVKGGVRYDKVYLFFKKDKLIQVYADTEGEGNVEQVEAIIEAAANNIGETFANKVFGQTYYTRRDTTYVEYEARQLKLHKVYFEVKETDEYDDRVYYTYYTSKVLPLFGVDY